MSLLIEIMWDRPVSPVINHLTIPETESVLIEPVTRLLYPHYCSLPLGPFCLGLRPLARHVRSSLGKTYIEHCVQPREIGSRS
ncbi:hypothetical protein J6590_003425 [Homalodisca vitripennis]|nr:hypothetical protein J6590_003425 [Homalodisca vitripennis]